MKVRVFLLFGMFWLVSPSDATAAVTICNGSSQQIAMNVALEDPNLRLLTRYPWTVWPRELLNPTQCSRVSLGRSDGMKIFFRTEHRQKHGKWRLAAYAVKSGGAIQRSTARFCVHPQGRSTLRAKQAVNCLRGYKPILFPYKISVRYNVGDYTLTLR